MSRVGAPSNLSKLFSIRVGNVPSDISSEKIYHDFATFGEIGDFYRPKLLDHHVPSRFLFIRYYRSDSGYRAMMEMHGKVYGDRIITVHDANDQDSFFTQDTGYITNEKFDSPEKKAKEFDASLPYNHYELKHKQELSLQVDHVITLRVDEISTQISKEQLESIFSEFGEVCSIYYPIDLKTRTHRGFAFIRYSHEGAANLALKNMDDANLGVGRNIRVSRCSTATYFSQDETATGKVYNHF